MKKQHDVRRFEPTSLLALIFVFAAAFAGSMTGFAKECGVIRDNTLRLHIIANSDSDEDQRLKLAVRDAILGEYSAELAGGDKSDAMISAGRLLGRVEQTANEALRLNGSWQTAKAELVRMYFPTKKYGSVTMPAGVYDALRVRIGSASGKNWWCVMFPPLCLPAAMDEDELDAELEHQFGAEGLDAIKKADAPRYRVRFALLELIESLFAH